MVTTDVPESVPSGPPPGDATITFPDGLPGFEGPRQFVLVASPALDPFTCLHGTGRNDPAFLAIDPRRVVPTYPCTLGAADRRRLEATDAPLLWLALVSPHEGGARVNLRAPLVVNPATMRGLQVLDGSPAYAFDHPLAGV
jgi:flagellar assembly factor FliW